MDDASRRYLVSGRVQGVGYRYFVAREADALGVTGWVRNLPHGQVEVVAEGTVAQLATLEGRLWEGPPHAHVSAVTIESTDERPLAGFRILSTPW